ncbi:MAG: hypothetical protein GF317_00635 [Candidatus Lokiarchaeota archaeon]|nr:hypothetical protein [Candidatus Lokiarchaeota archaeon]
MELIIICCIFGEILKIKIMDLKDIKTQAQMNSIEDWTKMTYGKLNLFDDYMRICDVIEKRILKDEDFQEMWGGYHTQEVYLGFSPEFKIPIAEDSLYFLSGWDLFTDKGGKSCIVELFLNDDGFKYHEISDGSEDIFYAKNSLYYSIKKARQNNKKNIIDIRLD